MTIKVFLATVILTPFLYGLGVAILQLTEVQGGYGEGRFVFAISCFMAFTISRHIFRADRSTKQDDTEADSK